MKNAIALWVQQVDQFLNLLKLQGKFPILERRVLQKHFRLYDEKPKLNLNITMHFKNLNIL